MGNYNLIAKLLGQDLNGGKTRSEFLDDLDEDLTTGQVIKPESRPPVEETEDKKGTLEVAEEEVKKVGAEGLEMPKVNFLLQVLYLAVLFVVMMTINRYVFMFMNRMFRNETKKAMELEGTEEDGNVWGGDPYDPEFSSEFPSEMEDEELEDEWNDFDLSGVEMPKVNFLLQVLYLAVLFVVMMTINRSVFMFMNRMFRNETKEAMELKEGAEGNDVWGGDPYDLDFSCWRKDDDIIFDAVRGAESRQLAEETEDKKGALEVAEEEVKKEGEGVEIPKVNFLLQMLYLAVLFVVMMTINRFVFMFINRLFRNETQEAQNIGDEDGETDNNCRSPCQMRMFKSGVSNLMTGPDPKKKKLSNENEGEESDETPIEESNECVNNSENGRKKLESQIEFEGLDSRQELAVLINYIGCQRVEVDCPYTKSAFLELKSSKYKIVAPGHLTGSLTYNPEKANSNFDIAFDFVDFDLSEEETVFAKEAICKDKKLIVCCLVQLKAGKKIDHHSFCLVLRLDDKAIKFNQIDSLGYAMDEDVKSKESAEEDQALANAYGHRFAEEVWSTLMSEKTMELELPRRFNVEKYIPNHCSLLTIFACQEEMKHYNNNMNYHEQFEIFGHALFNELTINGQYETEIEGNPQDYEIRITKD